MWQHLFVVWLANFSLRNVLYHKSPTNLDTLNICRTMSVFSNTNSHKINYEKAQGVPQ